MWTLVVVILDEFCQHRPEMLLFEDDDVVKALSAQSPDHSLRDGVGLWRMDGAGGSVDADAVGSLAELAAIGRIAIEKQMAWFLALGRGLDDLLPHQAAVGLAVTLTYTSSRRPWAMNTNTYRALNVSVGTVSRSAAQGW